MSYFRRRSDLGVCVVQSTWLFFKFVTELIKIGFVIIKIDAYQLGSVFQPILMRFDWLSLIGLVDLIWKINKKFVQIKKNMFNKSVYIKKNMLILKKSVLCLVYTAIELGKK